MVPRIRKKITRSIPSLLAVTAVLLIVLVTFLVWGILHRQQLDADSSALAIRISEAALERGDATLLVANAHPVWLESMSVADLQAYLASIPARLGPLQAITAIRGSSDFALLAPGETPSADYQLEARFQRSEARIYVSLRETDGRWLVSAFRVEAAALLN